MVSTYITAREFIANPTGLETASLIGNLDFLSGAHVQGATTLNVVKPIEVQLQNRDYVTIFDGSSSEQVLVAGTVNAGQTAIPLVAGMLFAHADGTEYCTDGSQGSLGKQIINASATLENICKQSLFLTTYTGEVLRMPGLRASIDNQGHLNFRPRHFPIITETGMTIESSVGNAISYDATQIIIDSDLQVCGVPYVVVMAGSGGNGGTYSLYSRVSRRDQLILSITYSAGYTAAAMPGEVHEAAVLLTSDIIAKRINPQGAAETALGKRKNVATLRGDPSGESLLYKRAVYLLDPYTMQPF